MKLFDILLGIISFLMVLYHMIYSQYLLQGPTPHMNTHLAFALILVFLSKLGKTKSWFWRISLVILMISSIAITGYIQLNFDDLQDRMWYNTTPEIIMGVILIFIVLEATRTAWGIVVPLLVIVVMLYPLIGKSLPEPFYASALPFGKMISNLSMGLSRGIWGEALSVSASYIFLWVLFGSFLQATGTKLSSHN